MDYHEYSCVYYRYVIYTRTCFGFVPFFFSLFFPPVLSVGISHLLHRPRPVGIPHAIPSSRPNTPVARDTIPSCAPLRQLISALHADPANRRLITSRTRRLHVHGGSHLTFDKRVRTPPARAVCYFTDKPCPPTRLLYL